MIKKILIITAFPPNKITAGQDYTRRLILDLLKKGYIVDLVYTIYDSHKVDLPNDVRILKIIYPKTYNYIRKFCFHPFFTKRLDIEILNYVKKISSDYDLIYFDFSQMHIYSYYIDHPLKVVVSHDVICQKFSRNYSKLHVKWIEFCEKKFLQSAKHVITFNQKDSCLIKTKYGISSICVNNYLKIEQSLYNSQINFKDKRMCFYGAWNRHENVEQLEFFIDNVISKIEDDWEFWVIGGGMDIDLEKKISKYHSIVYKGFVDNPIYELAKCQALVVPLYHGAGIKIKVIDAMTAGIPIIGTQIAFEGIEDNKINKLFFNAEKADDFIRIINGWKYVDMLYKKAASYEFCNRYNKNHFSEIINEL